ncbi:LOW QUALITY PROTEIN: hypothetical protein V2J09_011947 [Rumex salicifolius]
MAEVEGSGRELMEAKFHTLSSRAPSLGKIVKSIESLSSSDGCEKSKTCMASLVQSIDPTKFVETICMVCSTFTLLNAKKYGFAAQLVVIDEAAQLKECESTIPLQLPGLQHAILIGDEKQLPAMVQSKLAEDAIFGRSLFERLTLLSKNRHILNVQYRMHPSISFAMCQDFMWMSNSGLYAFNVDK